jgi:peptidoglycan/xylan/chitin deacetylase (PgdA/CDA1 family)
MYHYVHDPDPAWGSGVRGLSLAEFRAQLDDLSRELEPVDWPTLHAWSRGEAVIPDYSFLLTFDDGLADHARFVLPILEERRLHGVFFVPGAILAERCLLSAHAVHLLLGRLGEEAFEQELRDRLEGGKAPVRESPSELAAATRMYPYESPSRAKLKHLLTMKLPLSRRAAVVQAVFEKHLGESAAWARRWYVTVEEVEELVGLGHTVGGHGYRHEPLSRLSPADRVHDLRRLATMLNERLGIAPRPFSYPYGDFDPTVQSAVAEAGFVQAFTTRRAWITPLSNPFTLPRVDTINVSEMLKSEREWASV